MTYHASEMNNKQLVFLLTFSGSNHFSSTCRKRTKYSAHFSTSKWQLCLLQAGWRRSRHIAGLWCVTSSVTGSSYHSPSLWLLTPCTGQQNALSVVLLACSPSLHSSTCGGSSTINTHIYLYQYFLLLHFFFLQHFEIQNQNSCWDLWVCSGQLRKKFSPGKLIHPDCICEALRALHIACLLFFFSLQYRSRGTQIKPFAHGSSQSQCKETSEVCSEGHPQCVTAHPSPALHTCYE